MKPAHFYPLWWNPWVDGGLDFEQQVSISIDNLACNKDADYKILFLAEPYAVLPTVSEGALRNAYDFDRIYTFTQAILDKYPQAELFEWGSSWLDFKDLKISKKNNVSFVTSSKSQTPGHQLRLEIMKVMNTVDVSNGLQYYAHISPPFHERRNDFFEASKFHIAVENSQQKNYFTEKIIDCFASKTVPIYYGCPNIGDWFCNDGIITFNDIDDLNMIINRLDAECYENRREAIEKNYEIAKQFHSDNDVVPRLTRKIIEDVKNNATTRI